MQNNDYKKYVGNRSQLANVSRAVMSEGKADGMRIIDAANASGLSVTFLESRCLDIARVSYKGINMSFEGKAGRVSPASLATVGGDFTKYFQGGMLYTCGLENVGPPCEKGSKLLPQHGSISLVPAENVSAGVDWQKEEISVQGTMRVARLFGGDLALYREISIPVEENCIVIKDTVCNEGFQDEEIMLLYHFNFGYPMLSPDTKVIIDGESPVARDETAQSGIARWNVFEAPTDGRPEEVFFHRPKPDSAGLIHAKVENAAIGVGAQITYDKSQLEKLIEWKSMRSGDYALGIEPATANVGGYVEEKKAGGIILLHPGESLTYDLSLRFYDI